MEVFEVPNFLPNNTIAKRLKKSMQPQKVKINDKPYLVQRLTSSEEYLKFNIVIRKYVLNKYGLKIWELDMMLFLWSENLFKMAEFDRYRYMLGGKSRHDMFKEMEEKGLIAMWKEKGKSNMRTSYYTLTKKAKLICREMHNIHSQKVLMTEEFPGATKKQHYSIRFANKWMQEKPDRLANIRKSTLKR